VECAEVKFLPSSSCRYFTAAATLPAALFSGTIRFVRLNLRSYYITISLVCQEVFASFFPAIFHFIVYQIPLLLYISD